MFTLNFETVICLTKKQQKLKHGKKVTYTEYKFFFN